MSLLAGFDVVTELSGSAVLDLIKRRLQLGGASINPPSELTLPLSGTVTGTFHAILDDLTLTLDPVTENATLRFLFSNTSVLSWNPAFQLVTLDGAVTVTVPIGLGSPGPAQRALTAEFDAATVALTFSLSAAVKINTGLAGTGITAGQLKTFLEGEITTAITQLGTPFLGNGFVVTPGADGSLNPLVYTTLTRHLVSASPTNQAVCLLGNVLLPNAGNGNVQLKTAPAITPGNNTCVSIAPEAFHVLTFCPAMVTELSASSAGALPLTCGSAAGFQTEGVTLTSIADHFTAGHINVDGTFMKSGFCYDATGTFHGEITFSSSGATLTPNLSMGPPDVDVSVPWYCGPAGGVAIGVTSLISTAIGNAVAQGIADSYAQDAVDRILGDPLSAQNVGIAGIAFNAAAVSSEG